MPYMFVRYNSRSFGSAVVTCVAAVIVSFAGSILFAATTEGAAVDEAGTVGAATQASMVKVRDEGSPAGTDIDITATQCGDGEWHGTPLIARYQVSNYSLAKRTMPASGNSVPQTDVDGEAASTDLHQTTWMNRLLFDPSSQSDVSTSTFVLWREGDIQQRVAHEHPTIAISEVWNKPGDQLLRRSRHFDAFNRAIEFEPFRTRRLPNPGNQERTDTLGNKSDATQASVVDPGAQPELDLWIQKYHLAFQLPQATAPDIHPDGYTELLKQSIAAGGDAELVDALSSRQRCNELKVLQQRQKRYSSEMVWDESIRLPVYMQSVRDNSAPLDFSRSASERSGVGASSVVSRWVLVSLERDEGKVGDRFANWDSHDTTDFADIGDNESDPFLMRMINLGFISHGASGFYDASGNLISSGPGHYHPPAGSAR